MQGMLKKAAIFCAAATALLVASNASAQSYSEFTSGVFTFRAYQPKIVGNRVEVVGTATTSTSQGSDWCTYLYRGAVVLEGTCGRVDAANNPDVIALDENCSMPPGLKVTYRTLVKRVIAGGAGPIGGPPQEIWSPKLEVRSADCN